MPVLVAFLVAIFALGIAVTHSIDFRFAVQQAAVAAAQQPDAARCQAAIDVLRAATGKTWPCGGTLSVCVDALPAVHVTATDEYELPFIGLRTLTVTEIAAIVGGAQQAASC